jgi:hypothetical protein
MSIGKFVFAVVVIAWSAAQADAATLQQCEKVKLQHLKAEQSSLATGGKGSKAGGKGPSKRRRSADKLEEWLWKNCGSYAHELRSLEQQRM